MIRLAGDQPTVLERGEVDRAGQERGVGDDLAVHPESGHTAVGVNRQLDVGAAPRVCHGEPVHRVAAGGCPGDERAPLKPGQFGLIRVAVGAHGLHGDLGRVIAAEVGGVDHDPMDDASAAQPNDRVVVPRVATAPGLPAVVDLAFVPEGLRRELRQPGLDQVLLLGEELVVGVGHAPAERSRSEIGQARELPSLTLTHG
jgi:hypothetical protein